MHAEYLLEELCPKPVAAVLYEEEVLSLHEVTLVFCKELPDRRSQVHQLIEILKRKHGSMEPFQQALRSTFQFTIAETISIIGNK